MALARSGKRRCCWAALVVDAAVDVVDAALDVVDVNVHAAVVDAAVDVDADVNVDVDVDGDLAARASPCSTCSMGRGA